MKGGYVELNCGGAILNIASTQIISGIWERAVKAISSGKPLCLTNLFYASGKPYTNLFSKGFYSASTTITVNVDKFTINITSSNGVTVINDIVNANSSLSMTGVVLATTTAQSVSTIYTRAKTAVESGKPILLTGVQITSGINITPIPAFGYIASSTSVAFIAGVYQLVVSNNNTVTVTDMTDTEE